MNNIFKAMSGVEELKLNARRNFSNHRVNATCKTCFQLVCTKPYKRPHAICFE